MGEKYLGRHSCHFIFYIKIFKPFLLSSLMEKKDVIERAFVAGAAIALSYKERHPNSTESEVMSHATKQMKKIVREIQEDS